MIGETSRIFVPGAAQVGGAAKPGGGGAAGETGGPTFADALKEALQETNNALLEGDQAAVQLATGDARNLHEVILATERANLALQFTMAVRNKLVDAYNELMRMPV
ncbi:MAG: flagellar hook-basal body complex protein FliE [Chitinophagales bacterium]